MLGAYAVLVNICQADKLMDDGRRAEYPAKMDEAIRKRPDYWTYRVPRSVLAFQQGVEQTYNAEMVTAETVAIVQSVDEVWFSRKIASDL